MVAALVFSSLTVGAVSAARLYVPTLTATKADAFIGGDGDGKADPGETIEYTVTIPNTGTTAATGVVYDDTIDPNTTLVAGSVAASPLASDDTFPVTVLGNVSIDSAALSTPFSVTANDYLGLNTAATITAYDAISTQGGQVVMTTSGPNIGKFTYDPPAGFEGADTFTYTLSDNPNAPSAVGNRKATVSITVSGMVWFINNNASSCIATGCGRLSNPYSTLAAFNAANALSGGLNPDNNDSIFVYESGTSYSGAVTLRSGQKLIGQDATASLSAITGLTPPTGSPAFPAMSSANGTFTTIASTVTLNTNTTVRGLRINSTTSTGLADPAGAITGVSVSDASITTTTGTAVLLSDTGGTLSFTSISSGNGAANGISLTNTTGSFTVTGDGSNTSVGGNGSGGTISGTVGPDAASTGSGVYLNNAQNVTLRRMTINGTHQNYGIRGSAVNGFTLEYSTLNGTYGTNYNVAPNNAGEGAIYFGDTSTNGLATSGTFTNNIISGGYSRNLSIINTSGTATLTVKGNTLGLTQVTALANSSLAVEARNAGTTINATVGGSAAGESNTFTGSRGDQANFTGQTGTTMDVAFRNNTVSNSYAPNDIGGGNLTLATLGSMTFHVTNNTFRDANGSAITFFKGNAGTLLQGFFDSNTIGVAAVANSGAGSNGGSGNGIFVVGAGTGTMNLTITNNAIHQINGNGYIYADNTDGSYTANFGIEHNTFDTPSAGIAFGIGITNGAPASSDTVNACAKIGGSTAAEKNTFNFAGALGVMVGSSGAASGHVFNLPTYAGGANLTNVETFIANNNTGSFTTNAYNDPPATASAFTGTGTNCSTPLALAPASSQVMAQSPDTASPLASAYVAPSMFKQTAYIYTTDSAADNTGARAVLRALAPADAGSTNLRAPAAPLAAGENVNVVIGTLPAGKSVTIKYRVTVNGPALPLGTTKILNQGTVSSNELPDLLTTDGGPADCAGAGTETCTPVDRPDTTVVSLTRQSSNPRNAATVTWQVVFADPVINLVTSNFSLAGTGLAGASITSVTNVNDPAPSTTWNITADTGADGSLGLNMVSDTGTSHDITNLPYTGEVYTIDKTPPTITNVTSSTADGRYKAGAVVSVQVQFSEAVNVSGTPQLTLATGATNRAVDYTSGSGTNTLTFDYTVQAGDTTSDLDYLSTGALALNGGTIADAATNDATLTLPAPGAAGSLGANKAIVIDTTAPTTVSFTRQNPATSPTNADTLIFRVTFSEAIGGAGGTIGPEDFVATGTTGAPSDVGFVGPGVYDVTISGGDLASYNGVVGLNFSPGMVIRDLAGNDVPNVEPATDETYLLDNAAPAITNVTSISADGTYRAGAVIPIVVTFSEPVDVVGTPQLTLETGAIDAVADYSFGSGTDTLTFNYIVQAGDTSADLDYLATTALALNGGTIKDAVTNDANLTLPAPGAAGSLGANKAIVIDTTAPTVTNVTSTKPDGLYGTGALIPVTITFSEPVDVIGTPQLTLETGATDRVIDYASGSGTNTLTFNYTVQAGDISPDLDYLNATALALNGGAIADAATNDATLTLPAPGAAGSLGANKAIVIDATEPTVTNITSSTADGSYTTGAVISVQVTFSKPVDVTGTPQLTLETGATDRVVDYASGSGTATLTFDYTVQAGDTSADLDYLGTTALGLNGGTIKDAGATNDAVLTLPAPGAAGSLGANKAIVIDTTASTVTNVTATSANGSYTTGAVIPVTVTFDEPVDVTGTPQLTLETGATDRVIDYTSGSGTATLTFNYTVQAGDTSADLDYLSTSALALNGGTIADAATNDATLTLPAPGAAGSLGVNKAIVIDTTAPTVTNVTSTSANGSYTTGAVIPVTITFDEPVDVTGTPQLTLETGATDRVVDYTSGSGTATLTFNYTVQAGDTSADLDYLSTGALALNGGTIADAATNDATLTLPAPGAAGSLGANKAIVIDTTAPTVTNVTSTSADGSYTTGAVIPVTITFSKPVDVTGTPQLTLETGATDRVVDYTSGSGTATLTFNYTVQAGDTSADLDYLNASALALNGGTIKDAATNDATLTLPAPGAAGSLGANKAIVIDTTAPTVTNVTSTSANGSYTTGAVIPVTVTFDEPVTVAGTPQLTLETGATDRVVDYTSGSGTATLTFNYTVQAGDTSADLDYLSTSALALNGGTIKDAATNAATLTLPAPGAAGSLGANKAIVIDTTAPDTTITATPANPTNNTSATFSFTGNDGSGTGVAGFECHLDTGAFTACTSPQSYSGLADGSHTFNVRAIDSAGNSDATPATYTWTVDTTAPTATMTSTAGDPTNVSPIQVTVQFSEVVTGFDTGDITSVVNGTVGNFVAVDGDTFTFDLTPSGEGTVSAAIAPGSYSDVGNLNPNTTTTTFSRTYDSVAPTVTIDQAAGQSDPTSNSTINFAVVFSESVTGFTGKSVSLSGTAGATTAVVTGSGTTYNVAVSGMTTSGAVIATVQAGAGVDAAGNASAASTSTDNSVTYIFSAPPIITEGSAITVTMSENGSPTPFALTLHATDANSDPLTWSILTPATSGTASVGAGTGVVAYTPPTNYSGTDSFVVQVSDGNGGTDSITVNVVITATHHTLFLPMAFRAGAPDLVASISLAPNKRSFTAGEAVVVSVTVTNQGDALAGPFWVDLYINPSSPPTAANQLWNTRCGMTPCFGIAWQVPGGLAPGQSVTLTSQNLPAGYSIWPGYFASGTSDLYAFVDSFNPGVAAGAVAERDETNNLAELHGLSVTGTNPRLARLQTVAGLLDRTPRRAK
jgi:hypothetical protein